MKDLFYMGGPLFMSILTALLIIMMAWAIYHFLAVLFKPDNNIHKLSARLKHIKTIGLFAMITGILGQLIGLYQAFGVMEEVADISPQLFMGGLKVSMITTFYGIFIYLLSLLIWVVCDFYLTKE